MEVPMSRSHVESAPAAVYNLHSRKRRPYHSNKTDAKEKDCSMAFLLASSLLLMGEKLVYHVACMYDGVYHGC